MIGLRETRVGTAQMGLAGEQEGGNGGTVRARAGQRPAPLPRAGHGKAASTTRASAPALVRLVEMAVIPQLLARYGRRNAPPVPLAAGCSAVPAFAELVKRGDTTRALAVVDALAARGMPPGAIRTELLTGAARQLGEWWAQGLCSAADVSAAVGVLHAMLPAVAVPAVPPGPVLSRGAGTDGATTTTRERVGRKARHPVHPGTLTSHG